MLRHTTGDMEPWPLTKEEINDGTYHLDAPLHKEELSPTVHHHRESSPDHRVSSQGTIVEYKPSLASTQNRQAVVPQGETIAPPLPKKSPIDKWESRLSAQRVTIISLDVAPELEVSPQITTAAEVGGKSQTIQRTPL